MSSIKNSKAELIAIYRLEFYKKKNNWKFCANEKRKRVNLESVKTLNKTYDVETDWDEDAPALDQDMLDRNLPNISNHSTRAVLSPRSYIPKAKSRKPWPVHKEVNCTETNQAAQSRAEVEKHSSLTNYRTEHVKWANWEKEPDWAELNKDNVMVNNDCIDVEDNWAEKSNLATNKFWSETERNDAATMCVEDIWPENEDMWSRIGQIQSQTQPPEPPGLNYLGDGRGWFRGQQLPDCDAWPDEEICEAAATLLAAETCIRTDNMPLLRQNVSEDSCAEFLRGAHSAPHSSEIDLRFDRDTELEVSLSHLTSKQIVQRVASLAAVLRKLLVELGERKLQQPPKGLEQPYNLTAEECPTRDIGPSSPTNKIHIPLKRDLTYIQDDFLAGSFMQAPEGFLEDSINILQDPVTEHNRLMEINGLSDFLGKNSVLDAAGEGRFLQIGQGFMEVSGLNGRGRGRITDPVIGIGKGRPFRL